MEEHGDPAVLCTHSSRRRKEEKFRMKRSEILMDKEHNYSVLDVRFVNFCIKRPVLFNEKEHICPTD